MDLRSPGETSLAGQTVQRREVQSGDSRQTSITAAGMCAVAI